MSTADEIKKLADLKINGHLTDEEFESSKREILNLPLRDELIIQKEVAYYSSSVTAWLNYGIELNKQLLLFSSGGLALLLGLISTADFTIDSNAIYFVYACAAFYMVCMGSVLGEFKQSRKYIENLVTGRQAENKDCTLTVLGFLSVWSFIIGTICLVVFVIKKIH